MTVEKGGAQCHFCTDSKYHGAGPNASFFVKLCKSKCCPCWNLPADDVSCSFYMLAKFSHSRGKRKTGAAKLEDQGFHPEPQLPTLFLAAFWGMYVGPWFHEKQKGFSELHEGYSPFILTCLSYILSILSCPAGVPGFALCSILRREKQQHG